MSAPGRVAFRLRNSVGTPEKVLSGLNSTAHALPYRSFARTLAGTHAWLGANVARYAFIAEDLHLLLFASLPAHCGKPV